MARLNELIIHRFRGLYGVGLADCGGINLLMGDNNCGKTSVLEALRILCDPLNPANWVGTARQRDWNGGIEPVSWLFPHFAATEGREPGDNEVYLTADLQFPIRAVNAWMMVSEEMAVANHSAREESDEHSGAGSGPGEEFYDTALLGVQAMLLQADGSHQQMGDSFEIQEDGSVPSRPAAEGEMVPVRFIDTTKHYEAQLARRIAKEIKARWRQGYLEKLIRVLQIMEPQIEDLRELAPTGQPKIYLSHAKTGLAPFTSFGDGVRRSLVIAAELAAVENGLLLIDDLELGLHTSILRPLFRWLVQAAHELNVQVFAATHSIEVVDALWEVCRDFEKNPLVAYRLEQQDSGVLPVRLDEEDLTVLRAELGLEVRQ